MIGDGSNCKEPMSYKWEIRNQDLSPDSSSLSYYLTNDDEIEFAIDKDYLNGLWPAQTGFIATLSALNGDGIEGMNMVTMR